MSNLKISNDDLIYLVSLHTVDGLGPVRLIRLFEYFGSGQRIWNANQNELRGLGIPDKVISAVKQAKTSLVPEEYFNTLLHSKINILILYDNEYPDILKNIPTPPFILYYKGHFPTFTKSIGIVGTRKITSYGKTVTEALTQELVSAGFLIVSGLARGVDTIAHQTCIDNDGKTIAVLGGGINQIYPPENYKLAEQIIEKYGCIMSEFPPDYPHMPGNFPARNRIISGLSDAVLVTEAAEDSGSLITARYAAEQGKDVFAVPGPITSNLAKGPLSLIKDGAKLVTNVDDILLELGVDKRINSETASQLISELDPKSKQVIEYLENELKHIDEISRALKCTISEVSAILLKLEIKGLIKNLGSGNYIKF
jgi:DNA processing protein